MRVPPETGNTFSIISHKKWTQGGILCLNFWLLNCSHIWRKLGCIWSLLNRIDEPLTARKSVSLHHCLCYCKPWRDRFFCSLLRLISISMQESKRSTQDLCGRTEGNMKVIFPKEDVAVQLADSSTAPINPGDYVLVKVGVQIVHLICNTHIFTYTHFLKWTQSDICLWIQVHLFTILLQFDFEMEMKEQKYQIFTWKLKYSCF